MPLSMLFASHRLARCGPSLRDARPGGGVASQERESDRMRRGGPHDAASVDDRWCRPSHSSIHGRWGKFRQRHTSWGAGQKAGQEPSQEPGQEPCQKPAKNPGPTGDPRRPRFATTPFWNPGSGPLLPPACWSMPWPMLAFTRLPHQGCTQRWSSSHAWIICAMPAIKECWGI